MYLFTVLIWVMSVVCVFKCPSSRVQACFPALSLTGPQVNVWETDMHTNTRTKPIHRCFIALLLYLFKILLQVHLTLKEKTHTNIKK